MPFLKSSLKRWKVWTAAPLALVSVLALTCLAGCFSTVKPAVTFGEEEAAQLKAFDYADWTFVLKTYVNDNGQVDYTGLKADRAKLDRFVAMIASVGPKTRADLFPERQHKLAYYINAYNALTMFNVINRLPEMKSVNDDPKSFFYFTEFTLDGQAISLYNLENKVVRPEFNEPRIHFALNCASGGCPKLPAEPFLPETLEAQLARESATFLHETRNVTVEEGRIVLSHIFKWYAEDFKPDPVSWIKAQADDISLPDGAEVTHRPYDWSLNRQPVQPAQ